MLYSGMSVIVVGCERAEPKNAVVEYGWCRGKNTEENIGKVEQPDSLIEQRCVFRHKCRQSIFTRKLVQMEMNLRVE